MNIHEYQAKALLANNTASPLTKGGVAPIRPHEAAEVAREARRPDLSSSNRRSTPAVAAPGASRHDPSGKGGVRVVKFDRRGQARGRPPCSARPWSRSKPARRARRSSGIYVEEGCRPSSASSISSLAGRSRHAAALTIVASTEGGMDIEEVAAQDARKDREAIPPSIRRGLPVDFHGRKIAFWRWA